MDWEPGWCRKPANKGQKARDGGGVNSFRFLNKPNTPASQKLGRPVKVGSTRQSRSSQRSSLTFLSPSLFKKQKNKPESSAYAKGMTALFCPSLSSGPSRCEARLFASTSDLLSVGGGATEEVSRQKHRLVGREHQLIFTLRHGGEPRFFFFAMTDVLETHWVNRRLLGETGRGRSTPF